MALGVQDEREEALLHVAETRKDAGAQARRVDAVHGRVIRRGACRRDQRDDEELHR